MVDLWWPFVQNDAVLFHIVLLLSVLNIEALTNRRESRASKVVLGECVRLLAERLADPVQGLSDQTIVAVANLATISVKYLPRILGQLC